MKRSFILASALAFLGLGIAAPSSFAQPPPVESSADRGYDGHVEEFLPSNHGVGSMLLDNGVTVHFPASKADDVSDMAAVGSVVRVVGVAHPGPDRKAIVEAQKITNLDSNQSITFAPPVSPPPPR